MNREHLARLLISCPDQPGIVAATANFVRLHNGNIVSSSQHSTNLEQGRFFMRLEFYHPEMEQIHEQLRGEFQNVAEEFQMQWRLELASRRKQIALFVSQQDHCLQEILWQWESGQLYADIVHVISNHATAKTVCDSYGVPFEYLPVTPDTKGDVERRQLDVLAGRVDLLVLARYMQILTPEFVRHYPNRIINIHHSFLPAFIGRNPYQRAFLRGVKLIGATAHFVTGALDEGPIIEQDVIRVSHGQDAYELARLGKRVERSVLARALEWVVEDRVLVYENKTIVFT